MRHPVASFFDIDGTCSKRQFLLEFEVLIGEMFPERRPMVQVVHDALATYTNERTYDYGPVIKAAVDIVPEFFRGLWIDDALAAARSVVARYGHMTYLFPRLLLSALQTLPIEERGPIIAISAGPDFIAEIFCRLHGFDLVYSTPYESKDGFFTGLRDDRTIHHKGEVVDEIKETFGLDMSRCIGLGDTVSDLSMFMRVGHPFGMNPKGKLLKWIREHPQAVWVSDSQATGVTLFQAQTDDRAPLGGLVVHAGRFVETTLQEALPSHIPTFDLPGSHP